MNVKLFKTINALKHLPLNLTSRANKRSAISGVIMLSFLYYIVMLNKH